MVRGFLLRKTQASTSLKPGSYNKQKPSAEYHPCYSGFQVQGAANSPAAWNLSISVLFKKINSFPFFSFPLLSFILSVTGLMSC